MEPYLSREHAPVDREIDAPDLRITGALPADFAGTFVRNSPNPRFAPPGRHHWFDGDGMVHALRFVDGKADYRNRWVRTPGFLAETEAGQALWGGILDPITRRRPPLKDTANTHLVVHNGQLLATWWLSGQPQALSIPNLETLGSPPFMAAMGSRTVAAHPKVDPRTGELLFFGYSLQGPELAWVGIADRHGQLVRCEAIDAAGPRIPHDIGITENYVVVLDLPLGWDPEALKRGKTRIGFDRNGAARFGLWPRKGGPIRWFDVPACYVYHLTSSYEDGDSVVITGGRIDDPIPDRPDTTGTIPRLDTIHLAAVATRWRIDTVTGRVSLETLHDEYTEFPRVNDQYWTRRTRFAYHPRLGRAATIGFDGFIKLDHDTASATTCAYPPGWLGGEVVFAPKSGAKAEDDGWIATVLTHPDEPVSEAWILDARAVDQGPVATIALPWRIPLGFHADWIPAG